MFIKIMTYIVETTEDASLIFLLKLALSRDSVFHRTVGGLDAFPSTVKLPSDGAIQLPALSSSHADALTFLPCRPWPFVAFSTCVLFSLFLSLSLSRPLPSIPLPFSSTGQTPVLSQCKPVSAHPTSPPLQRQ